MSEVVELETRIEELEKELIGTHAIMEKSPCLHGFEHGTNGQLNKQLAKGGLIRRLTEVECERLQTVPDNYTSIVSSTQRYRMLGNGWTVDVIAHIFSFMALQKPKSEGEYVKLTESRLYGANTLL